MSRLPFEPPKPEQSVITITQLAARIEGALKSGIPLPVRFIGEVTGFRDRTHWYFDLKDANAVVSCVMFQNAARRAGFTPANGQQVVARGLVEFYAKSGKVSVILDSLEPVGAGALELAYRALCAELKANGYFDLDRKVPLPTFPRRIAVVTSKSGAALQDVLVTMKRRCPAVGVLVVDARMQGRNSAPEVAEAVRYLDANAAALGIDAILLTRGGGSLEDLWAFNEREVADAIFACRLPIVAAIGHETDTTIAELVADERCATPTQAAVRLTPDTPALLRQLDSFSTRLTATVQRHTRFDRQRLIGLARQPFFLNPRQLIARALERLDNQTDAFHAAAGTHLTNLRHRLDQSAARLDRSHPRAVQARITGRLALAEQRLHASMQSRIHSSRAKAQANERQLNAVGPLRVLDRGYSVTFTADGRVVRSPADVGPGEVIESRVAGGKVRSVVGDGPGQVAPILPPPRPAASKPRKPASGPPGPGLFGG
jgi:exodeoxyribonuclease VII large subunit